MKNVSNENLLHEQSFVLIRFNFYPLSRTIYKQIVVIFAVLLVNIASVLSHERKVWLNAGVRRSCLSIEMLYYTSIALSYVRYVEGISYDGLRCFPWQYRNLIHKCRLVESSKTTDSYTFHLILLRIARTMKYIQFMTFCELLLWKYLTKL